MSIPADIPSDQFFTRFSESLQAHLSSNSWKLPEPGSSGSPFERKPFRMLVRGKRSNQVFLSKPPKPLVSYEFTAELLSKKPYKGIPNTIDGNHNKLILFVSPIGGNVYGSINRFPGCQDAAPGWHVCAPFRAFEGWVERKFEIVPSMDTECFPGCPTIQTAEGSLSDDELPSPQQLQARKQAKFNKPIRLQLADQSRHVLFHVNRPAQLMPKSKVIEVEDDSEFEAAIQASLRTFHNESRVGESTAVANGRR
ncbi:interleukin-1 receptor-associated kinase 4 [Ceratobasidium sp. AG-Ba]|nr:interleukin-1 receptor-associated kinase 4 [Ceratobasidium sp. AG-Ba]